MKARQLIGLMVTGGSLLFLAACGDDNDSFLPPANTPTNTRPANTNTPVNTVTNTPAGPSPTFTEPPTQGPSATPTLSATTGPSSTPTLSPTPGGAAVCGNNQTDTGEQCDDGNIDGGDGCAANCTNERRVDCIFGGSTGAFVQTGFFPIELVFQGQQTLTAGSPRTTAVSTTDPQVSFNPGDIPAVIKVEDLNFEPVVVPNLVCACVRAAEAREELGPGNTGAGVVGCGPSGLQGTDVLTEIDHNINDRDPTCATGTPDDLVGHEGVCNGRLAISQSGSGPQGSAVINTFTSISVIVDGGKCAMNCDLKLPDGRLAQGPDCIPCTDDDPDQTAPSFVRTTTGTATARLFDFNNQRGNTFDCNADCGGSPCVCSTSGTPVPDCALLDSNPNAGIVGTKLVGAFPQVDAPVTGDILVTTRFECVGQFGQ